MDLLGRTLDNLHRGDTEIINGNLSVEGDHIVAGDIEVKQIEIEQINPLAPATDIKINADLDTQNNKLISSTNPTGVIIQGADFEAKSNINRVVDIDLRGNLTNLDTGFPQLLNPTLAGSTLYGSADIKTAQISYVSGTGDISVIDNLNMNDNKILNVTELTSTTQINMPQPLDMVGNSIAGVAEVRGFDGNPLLLNTFNDGSGLTIEEGGEIQAQKPLNLLSNAISGASSITINGNAKNTIIDNEFNTFDASNSNAFNVNTGGTHDFTINNQQKITIDTIATARLPIKLLNQPLQFDLSANIETFNTSTLSVDLEGENLTIRADPITDDAMEFEGTLGNFSFNKNFKAPSIQAITGTDLIVNSNLDMNSNDIVNVPAVKSNGDLSLENATGITEGIYIEDGGEILIKQPTSFQNNNVRSVNDLQTQTAKINDGTNVTFPLSMTPNGAFQVLGGVYIVKDLQVNGEIFCDTINNIRPSGGVYSESDGYTLAGDGGTLERPILNQGTSYGSLSVPAGGWTPGDTFAFKAGGQITCNNNATFTLRVCSNFTAGGGGLNEADFASIDIEVDGAQTADWWELEVEFICRATGTAGVAAISTNGHYSYFSSTDFQKGYGINNTNSSTFNTAVDNDLQIGFFSTESAAALSSFQVDQVSLTKLY